MRIGVFSGIEQYQANSKPGRISGVALPDFGKYEHLTKAAPAMSDEAYKEAIIKQAKRDYAAGQFQNDSAGFRSLEKSFTSVVSPDRKGIITNGLTAVFKSTKVPPEPLSLIELLLSDGSVNHRKPGKELTYAEFYDSEGNMVSTYSNGQWNTFHTPKEIARKMEMASIYNKAWGDAKRAAEKTTDPNNADSLNTIC